MCAADRLFAFLGGLCRFVASTVRSWLFFCKFDAFRAGLYAGALSARFSFLTLLASFGNTPPQGTALVLKRTAAAESANPVFLGDTKIAAVSKRERKTPMGGGR